MQVFLFSCKRRQQPKCDGAEWLSEVGALPLGIEKQGTPEHKYLYNAGTELEETFDLNLYETIYRRYDAQLGRFHGIDELAPLMPGITPYQYAFNNSISLNDSAGLVPEGSDAIEDKRLDDLTKENEEYGRNQNPLEVITFKSSSSIRNRSSTRYYPDRSRSKPKPGVIADPITEGLLKPIA
ncbi:RHS repeat-associated core domain-containing protein [uncultured Microscilla sp.]|uniref:RHS repeat domain-containing protein n=1 Tax=uncultured Microscilla sp. TaxID=432653 RepID=UPI002621830C|nr:RHS repeat-associated core domain-containing protein [uncultured Microscilla sp.]